MKWIVVLAGASLVVAGCARPWPEAAPVADQPVVAHCYITLAEKECYQTPQPGQEYRLIRTRVTLPR